MGPTEDYHDGNHPGDCAGTCDYCGYWWCPYADEIAQCDPGCEGYKLFHEEESK